MPRWNKPGYIVKRIFYTFEEYIINGVRFYYEVVCFPGYRDGWTDQPQEWSITLNKWNPKLAHWQYVSKDDICKDFRHVFKTNTITKVRFSINGVDKYERKR